MKYRNQKSGGFDSKKEHRRAQELQLLEKAGMITDLRYQVPFPLLPKQGDMRAVHYIADFVFFDEGKLIVEDVKSPATRTPAYIIKRKMMRYFHGITVLEV